jgi:hypothetical protein
MTRAAGNRQCDCNLTGNIMAPAPNAARSSRINLRNQTDSVYNTPMPRTRIPPLRFAFQIDADGYILSGADVVFPALLYG